MTFHTSTGTTIHVSDSLPSTYDNSELTGYASLDFAEIGEVVDISPVGKTYSIRTRHPIGRDTPIKIKTNYDHDDVSIICATDSRGRGQAMIHDAVESGESLSFTVIGSDGTARSFTGKILSAKEGPWVDDDVVVVSIQISVDAESSV